MDRRQFLQTGGGALAAAALSAGALSWSPRAEAATIRRTLYITSGYKTMPDGTTAWFRGYSSSSSAVNVPSTPIMAQQGDTVEITLVNRLSTRHNFKIDGVVNSASVGGSGSTTFSFQVNTPGTFLFYDGYTEPYGRVTGLHGALVVMPTGSSNRLYSGSPTFVQQVIWVFNDIDPAFNSSVRTGGSPSVSGFRPRHFTINGLSSRPPGHPDHGNPAIDAMAASNTKIHGHVGDRTLIRLLNAGLCTHSVHWHANHVEWLTRNGAIRSDIWLKDTLRLENNRGALDVIYPFEAPPDAWPPVTTGMYPMHLHDEMTQTSGGGLYMFGAMTDIHFE